MREIEGCQDGIGWELKIISLRLGDCRHRTTILGEVLGQSFDTRWGRMEMCTVVELVWVVWRNILHIWIAGVIDDNMGTYRGTSRGFGI